MNRLLRRGTVAHDGEEVAEHLAAARDRLSEVTDEHTKAIEEFKDQTSKRRTITEEYRRMDKVMRR